MLRERTEELETMDSKTFWFSKFNLQIIEVVLEYIAHDVEHLEEA